MQLRKIRSTISLIILGFYSFNSYTDEDLCALFGRASNLLIANKHTEAAELYKNFLEKAPYSTHGWRNLAICMNESGRFEESRASYKRLYSLNPTDRNVRHFLRTHAMRFYDWTDALIYKIKPYWWYNSDIKGKSVLIVGNDGGFGDAIQFIRYAKHLHDAGAYVIVQTPAELSQLFSHCPYIDWIIPMGSAVPTHFTVRADTPHLTITMYPTLNEPSKDIPYLFADEQLITFWADELKDDKQVRIGLSWRTSPMYNVTTNETTIGPRSVPLDDFQKICSVSTCSFYNLSKGLGDQNLSTRSLPVKVFNNLDVTHGRFMDTAALMKNLDLVITVDTSIAHLAGALGIPVWIVLPTCSDFRWFTNRSDSPWYPTARLFRQKTFGDWKPVIEEITEALAEFVKQHKR